MVCDWNHDCGVRSIYLITDYDFRQLILLTRIALYESSTLDCLNKKESSQ
jgi:hypothetical protein